MKACYGCGTEWTEREPPGFSAACESCGRFLHCCRNCSFHSPGHHNDCREPNSDFVRDPESRNHCEWFQMADREAGGGSSDRGRADAARARLEKLFGPPPGGTEESGE